jgi:hypothetical protein
MTRLDVRQVTVDAHRIEQDPGTWLPAPARPAGHQTWTTTLRIGPLHRQVTIMVNSVVRDGDRSVRLISWSPGERPGDILPFEVLLPSFTGELVAEEDELRVVGTYEPPAAWLGQVADVALRNAAMHTVQHLLHDIVEAMASVTTQGDPS